MFVVFQAYDQLSDSNAGRSVTVPVPMRIEPAYVVTLNVSFRFPSLCAVSWIVTGVPTSTSSGSPSPVTPTLWYGVRGGGHRKAWWRPVDNWLSPTTWPASLIP